MNPGLPIGVNSTLEQIAAAVRYHLYTAADGSITVSTDQMQPWLAEQLNAIGNNSFITKAAKQAMAASITADFKRSMDAIKTSGTVPYPVTAGSTVPNNEVTKNRLAELRNLMAQKVTELEGPYHDFEAGLASRTKALFNSLVAPSFPAGVTIEKTTRTYVETFVTDWGEESRPSEASALIDLDQNDSATITGSVAPTDRHVVSRRLYRSASGTTSSAFKLQGEYPIAQSIMVDDLPDEQLNEVCPTFGWIEPPANLKGLTGLPNGIMVGFVGRTLHFCEPYEPYAYPVKYDKPLAQNIIGLVAVGQSLFVGTTGRPYLVSGADSSSMSEELISSKVPCSSARSMVAISGSVFYASPDGLALYENGAVNIISKSVIDRDKWRSYQPETMRACEFDGTYYAFYTTTGGTRAALAFDYEQRAFIEIDQAADAIFSDAKGMYLLDGNNILEFFPQSGQYRSGTWHSKEFQLARPQGFGWLKIDSDFVNNGTPASVTVRLYSDNVLFYTVVVTSARPVRCPPGVAEQWRVEFDTSARVTAVVLATTTEELKVAA
jgi:hypothetical protein